MSQYMLTVYMVEGGSSRPEEDNQKAFSQVDALNTELQEKGAWVFAGGLHQPETATVVRAKGTETLITDGPFPEGKEHVGGFWVIEAEDLDAALAWATKASQACMEPVEVRPFQGV